MKKKYLLLLLISATGFASTGKVDLGMEPVFNSKYASATGFTTTKKYTLPYSFEVNYDEQGISFGVEDGKYNKDTNIGEYKVLKNEANLWASYNFDIAPHQSGMLKVENMLDVTDAGTGTIGTKLSGQYKYDHDMATYTGTLSYEGKELVFAPKTVEFKNKVDLLDDYTINFDLTNDFATSTEKNKVTFDLNAEIRKFGLKIKPGYKFIVKADSTSADLSNEMMLNASYVKDFDVMKLDASLKNKITFGFADVSGTFEYTMNPKVAVSKSFNLDPVTFDTKLTLEDKLVVKNLSAVSVENTFMVTPHLGASVAVTKEVKLSAGIDVETTVKGSALDSINTKMNLGFNYTW